MTIIILRRSTADQWSESSYILAQGEHGVELDDVTGEPNKFKIGDGVSAWNDLPYFVNEQGVDSQIKSVAVIKENAPGRSVKDYGAVGDGITDDTSSINAAIADSPAGGVINFPPGRFLHTGLNVTKPLTILGSGRHQYYDSSSQLVLKGGSNTDGLTVHASHVTLRDVMLYGNKASQSAASRGLVTASGNYFNFDNVWVDDFNGDAGYFASSSSTVSGIVSNCEFRNSSGYGVNVQGSATDLQFLGGYVDQNTQSGFLISSGDCSIMGVHVWGNGTATSGDRDGITLKSASTSRIINCFVESQTNGYGIYFKSGTMKNHMVQGCDIWNNGYCGILAYQVSSLIVANNQIRKNNYKGQTGYNGSAITNDGCMGFAITGNIMSDDGVIRVSHGYFESGVPSLGVLANNIMSTAMFTTAPTSLISGSTTIVANNAA